MTSSGRVVILLLFLSCVVAGNGDPVPVINQFVRCNEERYDHYDKPLDDLLKGLGDRAGQQQGPGFNTYYSLGSYHGHACCHPTLMAEDCSRCIHGGLELIRHRCGRRIGGFVSVKVQDSNYACEMRYEQYDMDDDYFSCARY